MRVRSGRLTLLVVLALAAIPVTADAMTRHVPGDYSSIQPALDASATGDTVLVAPGTYTGQLVLRRGLVLKSEAGPQGTIIDAQGLTQVLIVDALGQAAIVDGLTVTGGYEPYSGNGAGITILGTEITIKNCIIRENFGSGIAALGGGAVVDNCLFQRNASQNPGGGMSIMGAGTVVQNCTFAENVAYTGGALHCGALTATVTQCVMAGNQANKGGGISLFDDTGVSFQRCLVIGNLAIENGGGIWAQWLTHASFTGCTVSGNIASNWGGGLYAESRTHWAFGETAFWGNCALSGDEIFIFDPTSDANLSCCVIDTTGVSGTGIINYDDACIGVDPMFQAPVACNGAPTTLGDYHLRDGSPCLPEFSPCGQLIGALNRTGGLADVIQAITSQGRLRLYPNPSPGPVLITEIPRGPDPWNLGVFDLGGRLVRSWASGTGSASSSTISWDGKGDGGRTLPSGTYLVRLSGQGRIATGRLVILR